eukprot:GHVS01062929.1.p1 GENE.GHVS01062929.1~~GHVS01062929.1.p1  ORF type:complete len:103 (-),score=14.10 GHVS01062929.1:41-349(-)
MATNARLMSLRASRMETSQKHMTGNVKKFFVSLARATEAAPGSFSYFAAQTIASITTPVCSKSQLASHMGGSDFSSGGTAEDNEEECFLLRTSFVENNSDEE